MVAHTSSFTIVSTVALFFFPKSSPHFFISRTKMRFSPLLITAFSTLTNRVDSAVVYDTSTASSDITLSSFEFKSRQLFPAGPDLTGYGLGALEQIAYDSTSHILYGMSEQGYLNIFKFDGDGFEDLGVSIDFSGATLTDVEVCKGYLFVSMLNGTEPGVVKIFQALAKGETQVPSLISTATVGVGPDMIKPNSDCSIIAVANEGEGDYGDNGLVDPVGSVSLISGFESRFASPIVTHVALDMWTDEELLAKGVHMPLTANAMEYWDDYSNIADDLDFSAARASYTPDMHLEPEYVAWSADDSKLMVNLQENSAAVIIEVNSATDASVLDIGR